MHYRAEDAAVAFLGDAGEIFGLGALQALLVPGGAEVAMVYRLTGVGIGLAAIAVLVLAGRYLLDLVFRLSARCRRSI